MNMKKSLMMLIFTLVLPMPLMAAQGEQSGRLFVHLKPA
jgi:hypothetical protein